MVRRVAASPLTFDVVDRTGISQVVFDMWQNAFPLWPALRRQKRGLKQLRLMLRKTSDDYLKLRRRHGPEFKTSIEEDVILGFAFKGAVSTKELLTLDEAQELRSKARSLLNQDRFIREEQKAKEVPLKSRPADWRKPGWRAPHLLPKEGDGLERRPPEPDRMAFPEEHPECPECRVTTDYDRERNRFFCAKCGLEVTLGPDD